MSLSLILQEKNRIFISADSALSCKFNDDIYRTATNGKKIFAIDNNKILFMAGKMNLVNSVIDEYKALHEHNIEGLKELILKNVNENNNYVKDTEFLLQAILAVIENDEAVFYNIESVKDYKIERVTIPNGIGVYAAGIKNDIAMKAA
ncbi:MAG: hypothetical protein Q8936_01370 [Bacillota bacterium]|nr:hypothetical protein [Bacillota bacterium]